MKTFFLRPLIYNLSLAAFCFYNLSSIVNGLVYFDQFALISPLHLGLVVVGIVVLLAGVWVVSIQAGGGGVDVDRWKKDDEPLSDGDADTISVSSQGSEAGACDAEEGSQTGGQSQPLLVQGREQQTFGPIRMERQTVSESHAQPRPRPHSLQIRSPTVHKTQTLPIPITSPISRRMTSADPSVLLSPSVMRAIRRRQLTLQPSDTQHSLSPPLDSSSVLGSGLSIGLGPMSPGFSIIPRDRRRRISGLGFTDAFDVGGQRRRRTVSEGDMRRQAEGLEEGREAEVGEVGQEESGEEQSPEESAKSIGWNIWLRRALFMGRT